MTRKTIYLHAGTTVYMEDGKVVAVSLDGDWAGDSVFAENTDTVTSEEVRLTDAEYTALADGLSKAEVKLS